MDNQLLDKVNGFRKDGKRIVFVSGNFVIVHLGHVRLLEFAASCGDILIVGVNMHVSGDRSLSADMRLEGVRSISYIDECFIVKTDLETCLRELKPDIVVKGYEHKKQHNVELSVLDEYGGKLIFSSGENTVPWEDILRDKSYGKSQFHPQHAHGYLERHNSSFKQLIGYVQNFKNLNVIVIGDAIVDEYINCDPLGMSQEDPTLVVSPISSDRFLGGAAIVAAHIRGSGANVSYFCIAGPDDTKDFVEEKCSEYGFEHVLFVEESRPTTLKKRYRAHNKTLLRVNHLRQHDLSDQTMRMMVEKISQQLDSTDLVVFSDFNYGCLSQEFVDVVSSMCDEKKIPFVADSQSSSQYSNVSRFERATLLTPTEKEARLSVQDFKSGLVVLADKLKQKSMSHNIILTLGEEGVLIHAPDAKNNGVITDRLHAFNPMPKDVSGAGDALFSYSSLALASGASVWEAAYIGSVASGYQVSTVGNRPLSCDMIIEGLKE